MATGRLVRNFPWCHNKRPDGHTNYPHTTRSSAHIHASWRCLYTMVCGALRSVWNSIETSRILMAVVALKRSLYYRPRMTIELIMNYDDSFLRMWIVIGMIHVEARKPRKEMRDSFTVIRIIYPITNEKKRKLPYRLCNVFIDAVL